MKCTYCGEEKEFDQKMEMTIKSAKGESVCIGGECKKCGVSNFEWKCVEAHCEIKDTTQVGVPVEIR